MKGADFGVSFQIKVGKNQGAGAGAVNAVLYVCKH
jgi:hypothetical protein